MSRVDINVPSSSAGVIQLNTFGAVWVDASDNVYGLNNSGVLQLGVD